MHFDFLTPDIIGTAQILIGTGALFIACIVFERDVTKISNIFFLIAGVVMGLWSIIHGIYEMPLDLATAQIFAKPLYVIGAMVPIGILFFILSLSDDPLIFQKRWTISALLGFVIVECLIIGTNGIVAGAGDYDGLWRTVVFGNYALAYLVYAGGYLLIAFVALWQQYVRSAGIFRAQTKYILVGVLSATPLGFVSNVLLPKLGIFGGFWIGPLFGTLILAIIGYLIVKYNYWNPKLVLAEFFVSLMFLMLAADLVYLHTVSDLVVNGLVLVLVSISSVFLIQSIKNEVETQQEVERLLKDLEDKDEELHLLDREKSEFMRIAAHHLRDPLTAIKGYASMLIDGTFGKLDEKITEAVQRILTSSDRLVVIIDDFMDVSRIESGDMRYQFKDFDMKPLVKEVVEELRPSVEKSKLSIELSVDEQADCMVNGDYGKIRQVVSNLIDNSVKYTLSGGLKVSLGRENGSVLFNVKDTGIGMNMETLEAIFHKFSRAKDVSRIYTEGTGLGLYVAKEIVEHHKGRIWAESDGLSKGSRFFVELKAKNAK
jgi:signal transduction histidine kinase